MRQTVINAILEHKIIAIVRGAQPEKVLPVARALMEGGISLVEVTFDQKAPDSWPKTAQAIAQIADQLAGGVIVGAGTVLTPGQVHMAGEAGAKYIISPNADPQVIKATRERNLVSIPGALTPTEAMAAHQAGADFIKLFPVTSLGPGYIKAVKAPLSHLRFLAVGGIDEKNLADYLKAGALGAGIGGRLVNSQWIANNEFEKITALAKEYVRAAKEGVQP